METEEVHLMESGVGANWVYAQYSGVEMTPPNGERIRYGTA